MDIQQQTIFGERVPGRPVTIYFEGIRLSAREGQTVASALMAHGFYAFGHSRNLSQARGLYCGNGRCQSCLVTIDGIEHVKSCSTLVREGMMITKYAGDPDVRREMHEN
ncbi:(2Fe-2S)-binding protein [Sporomusa aerivorans]|uniref:(2Fe-2S)-binding protein n=1 Tax=Sporomusa aerivorans TaxID=204936 RepID=UPI00352A5488